MKLWVTLEGHEAEVEFKTDGKKLFLDIEGRRMEADFARLPDGEVYSLLVGGESHEVRVASGDGLIDVTLDGASFPVEVRHPLEKRLLAVRQEVGSSAVETLAAPMPGLVVDVRVKPGDVVSAGQAIIVVEAMKMQNELTTKHGGTVSEVLVQNQASVSAGTPLIRITPGNA